MHSDAVPICEKSLITNKLLNVASEGGPTHLALVLKIFGNWVAKRGNCSPVDSAISIQDLFCKVVRFFTDIASP